MFLVNFYSVSVELVLVDSVQYKFQNHLLLLFNDDKIQDVKLVKYNILF